VLRAKQGKEGGGVTVRVKPARLNAVRNLRQAIMYSAHVLRVGVASKKLHGNLNPNPTYTANLDP